MELRTSPAVRRRLPLRPGGAHPRHPARHRRQPRTKGTSPPAWPGPDAVGIRAPSPGTVAGDPACPAHVGGLEAGGSVLSTRSPMPPADLAEARRLLSAREAPAPARGCPWQRHTGRQPGTPAAFQL